MRARVRRSCARMPMCHARSALLLPQTANDGRSRAIQLDHDSARSEHEERRRRTRGCRKERARCSCRGEEGAWPWGRVGHRDRWSEEIGSAVCTCVKFPKGREEEEGEEDSHGTREGARVLVRQCAGVEEGGSGGLINIGRWVGGHGMRGGRVRSTDERGGGPKRKCGVCARKRQVKRKNERKNEASRQGGEEEVSKYKNKKHQQAEKQQRDTWTKKKWWWVGGLSDRSNERA